MRPVPLSRWAGILPLRAHLTRVRGATFRCSAASDAVNHSELCAVTKTSILLLCFRICKVLTTQVAYFRVFGQLGQTGFLALLRRLKG